jgi:hypothetical protein
LGLCVGDGVKSDGVKSSIDFDKPMTRANKILIRLRDAPFERNTYRLDISLLTYDTTQTQAQLYEIKTKFDTSLRKRVFIEKWRNRLFELNIRYGLHTILSEIDLLKKERTELKKLYQSTAQSVIFLWQVQ